MVNIFNNLLEHFSLLISINSTLNEEENKLSCEMVLGKISEIKPIYGHSLKNDNGKLTISIKDIAVPDDNSGETFTTECKADENKI